MRKQFYSSTTLLLIAGLFFVFVGVTGFLFKNLRLDLTESKLYTLSQGSKNIVENMEGEVTLQFFFSKKLVEREAGMVAIADYAKRVEEFLTEYYLINTEKLKFRVIDPEPFSSEEELAAELGVQPVPLNNGDSLYFGLVGTNAAGEKEVIPFFQSEKEQFLEYDISKLIYNLANPSDLTVGIITNFQMSGGYDYRTGQQTPPWAMVGQIEQLYTVEFLDVNLKQVPQNIDLLVAVQPETLKPAAQYALDQFVVGGGKAIIFADPLAEFAQAGGAVPPNDEQRKAFSKMLAAWGVGINLEAVVGDSQNAMLVNTGPETGPVRMMPLLNLGADYINEEDIITNGLENVNLATAGVITELDEAKTVVTPLISTSESTMLYEHGIFRTVEDPRDITRLFQSSGEKYILAARVEGAAKSGFDARPVEETPEDNASGEQTAQENAETQVPEELPAHIAQSENINVLVIADSDVLTDRLWVRVQNFFGQQIATAWSDNANLLINAIENLSGSSDLISVRSRGKFYRGFDVVDQLRRNTEEKFRDKEKELNEKLEAAEAKLAELQNARTDDKSTMTPEQQQAIIEFQKEKIQIRKALREVRHALDKDIETLGVWVKVINILLMPLLIVLVVVAFQFYRKQKQQRAAQTLS